MGNPMKKHPAWQFVLLGAVTLLSWSCATPVVPRQVSFKEADFARTSGTGSGTVVGQAFTVLRDNSVRYGKDVWLLLLPVTGVSVNNGQAVRVTEWSQGYTESIGANRRISDVADRAYLWKTHFDKPENESPLA
jgi:hypothetical protein